MKRAILGKRHDNYIFNKPEIKNHLGGSCPEEQFISYLVKRIIWRFFPKLPYHILVLVVSKTWFLFLQSGKLSFFKSL